MRCCRTGLKTKRKFQLFSLKAKYSASFRSSSTFFVSRQQEAKLVAVLLHSSFLLEDPELLATADVDYTAFGGLWASARGRRVSQTSTCPILVSGPSFWCPLTVAGQENRNFDSGSALSSPQRSDTRPTSLLTPHP